MEDKRLSMCVWVQFKEGWNLTVAAAAEMNFGLNSSRSMCDHASSCCEKKTAFETTLSPMVTDEWPWLAARPNSCRHHKLEHLQTNQVICWKTASLGERNHDGGVLTQASRCRDASVQSFHIVSNDSRGQLGFSACSFEIWEKALMENLTETCKTSKWIECDKWQAG